MPKPLQCAHCKKVFLTSTYGIVKHVETCIANTGKKEIKRLMNKLSCKGPSSDSVLAKPTKGK